MHSKSKQDTAPLFAIVLFTMISAAACEKSSTPTPETRSPGEPPAEPPAPQPVCTGDCYVLLNTTAALRVRPAADAPTLAQEPDDPDQTGPRRIPLRYIGEKDGWVEVETLPARGGAYHASSRVRHFETGMPIDLGTHCYEGAVLGERGLGVHLYVQRNDLETVTTRPVRVEFPDKTAVALAPGVVVEPLPASGLHRVRMSYLTVELALPADGVGSGYVASPLFDADRLVTIEQPCIQIMGIVDATHVRSSDEDDKALGALLGRLAPAEDSGDEDTDAEGIRPEQSAGGTAENAASEPVLRAGAQLTWKDGQIAGRAIEDVRLAGEPTAAGERQCQGFERDHRHRGLLSFFSSPSEQKPPGEPLELCFAVADISK